MKYPRIEGAVKLTSFVKPMLAELSTRPAFSDPKYIFEIKWDGYRAIAEIGEENRLYSRKGTSFSKAFPVVFKELSKVKGPAIIDGEIVVYSEDGKPSFQLIQNYRSTQRHVIQFQVFDCLEYKGKDLRKLPLIERKAYLQRVLPESNVIRYCDHVEADGKLLFDEIVRMDLEGMMAKVASSTYINDRSKNWLKIKNHKFQDFLIIGFLYNGTNIKSLVLAEKLKGKIVYRGCVSGFSDMEIRKLITLLKPTVVESKPVSKHEKFDYPVAWVNPQHLCNVRFYGVDGRRYIAASGLQWASIITPCFWISLDVTNQLFGGCVQVNTQLSSTAFDPAIIACRL
jgi:bifunctional non-homologous end joining protein LigD